MLKYGSSMRWKVLIVRVYHKTCHRRQCTNVNRLEGGVDDTKPYVSISIRLLEARRYKNADIIDARIFEWEHCKGEGFTD